MRDSYYLVRRGLSFALSTLRLKPFVEVSAEEYIWGYDDPLFTTAKTIVPKEMRPPGDKFGILVGVSTFLKFFTIFFLSCS